jgi:hypothetical protein
MRGVWFDGGSGKKKKIYQTNMSHDLMQSPKKAPKAKKMNKRSAPANSSKQEELDEMTLFSEIDVDAIIAENKAKKANQAANAPISPPPAPGIYEDASASPAEPVHDEVVAAAVDEMKELHDLKTSIESSASASASASSSASAPVDGGSSPFKTPEEALTKYFGEGGLYHLYYESIIPSKHFAMSLFELDESAKKKAIDEIKRAADEKKARGEWDAKKDEEELRAKLDVNNGTVGRYVHYRRAQKMYQLPMSQIEGAWKMSFLGRTLDTFPDALVMTPFCAMDYVKLGVQGDVGTQFVWQPRTIDKASFSFAINNRPIPRDGYHDENNRNPHAEHYFDWVRSKLIDGSIAQSLMNDTNYCKAIKQKINAEVETSLIRELIKEKKAGNNKEAKTLMETKPEIKEHKQKLMISELEKNLRKLIQTNKTENAYVGGYIDFQTFKRSIFRKAKKGEAEGIKQRLAEGYYKHLPMEYIDIMTKAEGKLVYDPLYIFRFKRPDEINAEDWANDPYPFIELTWEERARLSFRSVCSVIYEVPVTENIQGKFGPQTAKPFAVFVASFDSTEVQAGAAGNSRAEREKEWKKPCVFPSF